MSRANCDREPQVLDAVISGRWPHAAARELRMHVDTCETCRDVALVAPMLRDDYMAWRQEVQVPAASQVWWRAAVRARMETAHAAARPLTWTQGVAGASAAGLLVALIGMAWPSIAVSFSWIAGAGARFIPAEAQTTALLGLLQRSLPLLIVAVVCAMLAPVAVYLALSDD